MLVRLFMREKYRIYFLTPMFLLGMLISCQLYSQDIDSSRVMLGSDTGLDSLHMDSTKIIEDAALDIEQDRGYSGQAPSDQVYHEEPASRFNADFGIGIFYTGD